MGDPAQRILQINFALIVKRVKGCPSFVRLFFKKEDDFQSHPIFNDLSIFH